MTLLPPKPRLVANAEGVRLHALGYPTPITGDPNDPLLKVTETNSAITIISQVWSQSSACDFLVEHIDQVEWAFQMMQVLALGCVKLSFVFFYRRMFVHPFSSWFDKATMAMIAIIIIWMTAFFFALLFACKGNWSAWWGSVSDLATNCVQILELGLVLVTSDFATDVIIMALPMPMVCSIHLENDTVTD